MRLAILIILAAASLAAVAHPARATALENEPVTIAPGAAKQVCIGVRNNRDRYVLKVISYAPIPGGSKITVRETKPDDRSSTPLAVFGMFPDRPITDRDAPRRFLLPPTDTGSSKAGILKCFSVQLGESANEKGHATVSLGRAPD